MEVFKKLLLFWEGKNRKEIKWILKGKLQMQHHFHGRSMIRPTRLDCSFLHKTSVILSKLKLTVGGIISSLKQEYTLKQLSSFQDLFGILNIGRTLTRKLPWPSVRGRWYKDIYVKWSTYTRIFAIYRTPSLLRSYCKSGFWTSPGSL